MVKLLRNLFKGAEAQEEVRTMRVIHPEPVGSAGTESYAGYPNEEYLDSLRGTERAKTFDKMRRSDSQIKMCLSAVKNPIKSATWEMDPAEGYQDEPWAKEDAELMQWILFNGMEKTWRQTLHEILSVLDFGHSVFEIVDKVVFDHPKFGSINTLRSMAFRSPKTIERWNLDKATEKLVSISQYAYGDLDRMVDIPAEFLVIFSLDKEGANYEGISALRCTYGNYFRKNAYLKINSIGIDKFAVPTPIATVPANKTNTAEFANLIAALEAYMSHEKGYITVPEGWTIDLKN
jgi:hypothetical protein